MHRRTATKVVDGRVRKKNNWKADRGDYFARPQSEIRLDRRDPGPGRRHLLTIADLRKFLPLLPDWDELAKGLDAIVLDAGNSHDRSWSWSDDGLIGIASWAADLWWEDYWHLDDHDALDLIGVEYEQTGADLWQVRWSERQAHAFQLVRVLPYAMAHHRDDMIGRDTTKDEAERYARRMLDELWPAYCSVF